MGLFLITGGAGFIGSHLAWSLLADGHQVRVLDDLSTGLESNLPTSVDLRIGSVTEQRAIKDSMVGVDGCFHLAAIASVNGSSQGWAHAHGVNLTGAVNVFEQASQRLSKPIPVVYASSAAIYGDNPIRLLSEYEIPNPLTPYGADKLGCEQHARVATRLFNVPTFGLRFFNVYGPRQDPGSACCGVVSIFAQKLLDGAPLPIFGDGKQIRDFIFVGDAIRFLKKAMDRIDLSSQMLNVCTGEVKTILDIIDILQDITGTQATIQSCPPRPGDIQSSTGCPANAETVLGLKFEVELISGIQQTVDWLKNKGGRA